MASRRWPAWIGAALAVVLVAAAVVALVLLRPGAGTGAGTTAAPSKVVVVFAMGDEDHIVTAQLVVVVDVASGRYELHDTSATVPIPGTSYTQLRDAYPFGGAQAVAAALDGGSIKPGTAWVDVSPQAWQRLLAAGVDVTITAPFQTFDDVTEHYSQFETGPQHVAATDLWGLVNGLSYLDAEERSTITDALAAASLRALASAAYSHGIGTDLTPTQWADLATALQRR
jgi:hypothetical protein